MPPRRTPPSEATSAPSGMPRPLPSTTRARDVYAFDIDYERRIDKFDSAISTPPVNFTAGFGTPATSPDGGLRNRLAGSFDGLRV